MATLLALLSQQQPNLQTRKGLILTGLQNDFLSSDGKLPVKSGHDYVERIRELVPSFREYGDVIWVRSQFEANREVTPGHDEAGDSVIAGPLLDSASLKGVSEDEDDEEHPAPSKKARTSVDDSRERPGVQPSASQQRSDADEELFLSNSDEREACCIKGSYGAEYAIRIQDMIDPKDLQVTKTYYSAFGSTSLLLTLRSKLITELFVGGNMTNISVYATALDAARYGIKITLLEDCLGYRHKDRHEAAIKHLRDHMGAEVVTADQALELLKNPPEEVSDEEYEYDSEDDDLEEEAEEEVAVGRTAHDDAAENLEADSDGEDEEFDMLSTVRDDFASHLPSRRALSSSSKVFGLHDHVQGREHAAPARESPNTTTEPKTAPMDAHRERAAAESGIGSDNKRLESRVDGPSPLSSSSGVGVAADESSSKVKIKASVGSPRWAKTIGAEYTSGGHSKDAAVRSSHPGLGALATLVGLDQRTVDEYEAMMKAFKAASTDDGDAERREQPLFGVDEEEESAGSKMIFDLLPAELADTIFEQLNEEVSWQTMHHQTGEVPRLVCCQGTVGEDGSMPVYRHPSDQTLPITRWTPTVDRVRRAAEEVLGHPLNHALIQLYRGGHDFISEHSDKTLDIARDSYIANVSFGAQRTMRLRTKRGATAVSTTSSAASRTIHRVPLPHNSMVAMTLPTNAAYLHGINADKRPRVELSEAERAFEGQRISLTFRHIATFLNADSTKVWGQGATGRRREDAKPVVNGDAAESERIVRAFGAENQASSIQWDEVYGDGFDVLHLR